MRNASKPGRKSASKTIVILVSGILLSVAAILLGATYLPKRSISRDAMPATVISSEVLHAAWVRDVGRILDDAGVAPDRATAGRAKQALLDLRVAREDRDAHVSLVLALGALEEGRTDAFETWTKARRAVGK